MFRREALLSIVAVALNAIVAAQPADAAPPKVASRWALLVGVDNYAYAQDLTYCGADQVALRDKLRAAGFPDDHIFLLHDKATDEVYQPSKGNIERQLNVVLNLAEADDLVVVAFSGHGVHIDGKSFLCPKDATLDKADTLVSLDDLYARLQDCAAAFKLVIVDACRNDPRLGTARSFTASEGAKQLARNLEQIKLPQGVVLLNSCAPGEISREEADFGHGVFMHYVLEGLSGAADKNGDGAVSLTELKNYAGERTKVYVARKYSDSQRPFYRSEGENDLMEYALLPVVRGTPTPSIPAPPAGENGPTIINSIGMKLVLIPAGEFTMGSDETAADLRTAGFVLSPTTDVSDESPAHRVRITKPYYLGVHEVTVGQFRKFVEAEAYVTDAEQDGKGGYGYNSATTFGEQKPHYNWRNTGFPQTDDHPVVNVTHFDAVKFCEWLSERDGRAYRLPTEAEWEYACRAGTTTRFFTGDGAGSLAGYANVQDSSFEVKFPNVDYAKYPSFKFDDGWPFTAPVGRFKPNPWGLHDMTGNVWEWCYDWYDAGFYENARMDDPWMDAGSERVIRGGSWFSYPSSVGRRTATSARRRSVATSSVFASC